MWASKKVKRVVKSTTAAEALALAEGLKNAVFLRIMLHKLLGENIPIVGFTDSRNLAITVNSLKHLSIAKKTLKFGCCKHQRDDRNWYNRIHTMDNNRQTTG